MVFVLELNYEAGSSYIQPFPAKRMGTPSLQLLKPKPLEVLLTLLFSHMSYPVCQEVWLALSS